MISTATTAHALSAASWDVKVSPNGGPSGIWHPTGTKSPGLAREFQGYVEYRGNIAIPEAVAHGEPLGIYLGQVGDVDRVFINGNLIGVTGGFPPNYEPYLDLYREYIIPPNALRTNRSNDIFIQSYVEYVGNKGVDLSQVQIGSHKELQRKKYVEESLWYLVKLGLPILCLFMSLASMPWMAAKSQLRPNILLFLIGLCYCLFGIGKSRVIFHFLPPLVAYKLITLSALFGLVFVFIYSLDLCQIRRRWPYAFAVGIPTGFALPIFAGTNLLNSSIAVKHWLVGSIPLLLVVSSSTLFLAKDRSIWVRIGLAGLAVVAANDVFNAIHWTHFGNFMDIGFSLFIVTMLISHMAGVKRGWMDLSKRESDLQWSRRFLKIARQVGHDVRSPVGSMEPAVETLNHIVASESFPDKDLARAALDDLQAGLRRISSMSSKVLTEYKAMFEQSGTSDSGPQLRLTLVDKLILDVVNEARATAPAHVSFQVEGFGTVPQYWGVIEVSEIQAAVSNIIRNGIDAMVDTSREQARLRVVLSADSNNIRLSITDHGCGIPAEVLPRIFEEGFTAEKPKGNGLGLSQAKKAIEINDGTINVRTEVEHGTTMTIELPREPAPKWYKTEIPLSPNRELFFVDDDPTILAFFRTRIQQLKNEKLRVSYHSSIKTLPIGINGDSIFVLDNQLRDDELEGLEWLKKQPRLPETYLCTAEYDDPTVQNEVKNLGIYLIPKPAIGAVSFQA